jgi:hypothetical protein
MNWFVNKLGPSPTAQRNAANGASRNAAPVQKGAAAQKNAPAPKASAQRSAPAPAPEPDKKKKKGWF